MNFYKVPTSIVSIETLKNMTGSEGTYLNPILDENDIWIISVEEFEGSEFQQLKEQNQSIFSSFELINTNPKQYPELLGIQ